LFILISVFTGMLFLRNDVEATVLRLPGQLYERKDNNIISNVFTYKVVNKTTDQIDDVSFKLTSHNGTITLVKSDHFIVPKQGFAEGTLFIEMPRSELSDDKEKVSIAVYSKGELIETTKTTFLGPRSYK